MFTCTSVFVGVCGDCLVCFCICVRVCACVVAFVYTFTLAFACECVRVWEAALVCVLVCASVFSCTSMCICIIMLVHVCGCVHARDYISASSCAHVWLHSCTHVHVLLLVCVCVCVFVCVCVGGWVVAPLVCGVCVERQRSLVPILYRLLISECVVAKYFLFLFSSRESIPWFLSVPRGRTRPPHMSRYLCVYTISYSL